ncbi:MAG: radical SAM protein [Candidatus Tectomicrobia bacterium]|uniref:Radical SAM protein n=1 Tax=Tectimicrobiota bacterium TaxID=2528274 RepID=A0A932CPU3_UNCTE|nr:radical SAM protein [Candidatus Tectomicrobia bacterium]
MYTEAEPQEYHSAIVDVTDRCNLKCRHCYYYREEHASQDLSQEEFLEGIRMLRDRHHIQHMSWAGGEPLLRREVIEEGAALFQRNVINTNGLFPLPQLPRTNVWVSIDGPPEIHDYIRGKGTYARMIENVKQSRCDLTVFCCTVNQLNTPHLDLMFQEITRLDRTALVFAFFTPLKSYQKIDRYTHSEEQRYQMPFTPEERDRAIDHVLQLKARYPGYILNPDRVLDLMRSENAPEVIRNCNMTQRTLTLDVQLNRKLPCVVGSGVDCTRCGCFFPYMTQALREKDPGALEFFTRGVH